MRWPWVSRAAYEALERRTIRALDFAAARAEKAEAVQAEWSRLCADERNRYNDLFAAYDRLRVQGATAAAQKQPAVEKPDTESDRAIEEKVRQFGGSAPLRRILREHQKASRAAGADEDEIARQITHWSDPDEDAA